MQVRVRHVVRGVPDRVVGEEVDVSAAHEVELHGEALRAQVRLDQDGATLRVRLRARVRVRLRATLRARLRARVRARARVWSSG